MGIKSKNGQIASIEGKLAVTHDLAADSYSVEVTVRSHPDVAELFNQYEWVEADPASPKAAAALLAFKTAVERFERMPVLRDYRMASIADWAANLASKNTETMDFDAAVRVGTAQAYDFATKPAASTFDRLAELGIELDASYLPRVEKYLANAQRLPVTDGTLDVLNRLRYLDNPAGKMFSVEDQLDGIKIMFPELGGHYPGYRSALTRSHEIDKRIDQVYASSKDPLNNSVNAMQQQERLHKALLKERAQMFADHYLHSVKATIDARKAISGDNYTKSFEKTGVMFSQLGKNTIAYYKTKMQPIEGFSNEQVEQMGPQPVIVAVTKGQFSKESLYQNLSATIADHTLRLGNKFETAVREQIKIPKNHTLSVDVAEDAKWNFGGFGDAVAVRIDPDSSVRSNEPSVKVELRLFIGEPRGFIIATSGTEAPASSKDLLPDSSRFPKADTFDEVIETMISRANFVLQRTGLEMQEDEDAESYLVSVSTRKYSLEDLEIGEGGEFETITDRELVDEAALATLIRNKGIASLSIENHGDGLHAIFSSDHHEENTEFFEHGITTYIDLHLHQINGKDVGIDDAVAFADKFGLKHDGYQLDELEVLTKATTMRMG